jgi:hypothetical protein
LAPHLWPSCAIKVLTSITRVVLSSSSTLISKPWGSPIALTKASTRSCIRVSAKVLLIKKINTELPRKHRSIKKPRELACKLVINLERNWAISLFIEQTCKPQSILQIKQERITILRITIVQKARCILHVICQRPHRWRSRSHCPSDPTGSRATGATRGGVDRDMLNPRSAQVSQYHCTSNFDAAYDYWYWLVRGGGPTTPCVYLYIIFYCDTCHTMIGANVVHEHILLTFLMVVTYLFFGLPHGVFNHFLKLRQLFVKIPNHRDQYYIYPTFFLLRSWFVM